MRVLLENGVIRGRALLEVLRYIETKYGRNYPSVFTNSSSQLSTTEPSSYDSSGSFFLHDPSTVGYNRLSDLFPSSVAQTVCSDDSGVGLTSPPHNGSKLQKHTKNYSSIFPLSIITFTD